MLKNLLKLNYVFIRYTSLIKKNSSNFKKLFIKTESDKLKKSLFTLILVKYINNLPGHFMLYII